MININNIDNKNTNTKGSRKSDNIKFTKTKSNSKDNKVKVKPLKTLQKYDKEFFKIMSRTGFLNRQMAYNNIEGMTKTRIDMYLKNNIIKNSIDLKGNKAFKLTHNGKDYIKKTVPETNKFYAAQSQKHDLKLAEAYFKLNSEQQNTFMNETELKNYIFDRWNNMEQCAIYHEKYNNHEMSNSDGAYITYENGIEIINFLEITTSSYGEAEIQSKIEFANTINAVVHFIKA